MNRRALVLLIAIVFVVGALVVVGSQLSLRREMTSANERLDLAAAMTDDADWEGVIQALADLEAPKPEINESALLLLAQASEALGERADAEDFWQRLHEEGDDLHLRGQALLALARGEIEHGGALDAAEEYLDLFEALGAPGLNDQFGLVRGRLLEEDGDIEGARASYAEVIRRYPDSDSVGEVEEQLSALNLSVLFSRHVEEGDELYSIQAGDTLGGLGRRHRISARLIQRVNNISSPQNLRIGHRIKIPHRNFRIEVYKDEFALYVFDGDEFFAKYRCRLGREDYMTPVGAFTVEARSIDPTWNDPITGRTVPAGDPENALGSRWMGFREVPSIGIHGTIDPSSIGTAASNGCIGLINEEVEELYDLIPRGTEVRIFDTRPERRLRGTRRSRATAARTTSPEDENDD